jgi:hypothetical protein
VKLARRGSLHRAVRDAVDHHSARATNPFPAIMVERNRRFAAFDQTFVDGVEHLEERHVGADVARLVALHLSHRVGTSLTPNVQSEVHAS